MKITRSFPLAILLVLLAPTLPCPGTGADPLPEGEMAVVSSSTSATQPTLPIAADLLAAVEAELDPDLRSDALERVVQSISDAGLPAVLDAVASDPSPTAADLRQLLVRRWAENDAPAAVAWTALLAEGTAQRGALEQVAIAWANSDLPAATAWVQAMPPGDSKTAAALSLGYEAARSEPVTALVVASTLPAGPPRDDLLVHAASQWAMGDSTVAADWAGAVPDVNLRERLLGAVAVALAGRDSVAAATLAATTLGAGDEQDRALVSIMQRWAQNSPNTAALWVTQWPDTPARDAAAQNLLAVWTVQDSQAPATWLDGLPEGALRKTGFSAYRQALADRGRDAAATLETDPVIR